jgi:hypothetical protein
MTLNTASAQELASESETITDQMSPTTISGSYGNYSIQIPPSIPTPPKVIPKSYTLNLSDYSWKQNVTIQLSPAAIRLDYPYICHNATGVWQSSVISLPEECVYRYNNFTITANNATYRTGLDQVAPGANSAMPFGDGIRLIIGQSFTPTKSEHYYIRLIMGKIGLPQDGVLLGFYEAQGNLPIGPILSSIVIPANQLPPWGVAQALDFYIKNHFNTSKTYIFTVQRTSAFDPQNYYQIAYFVEQFDVYPPGKMSVNTGVWNIESSSDLFFYTYYFEDSYIQLQYRTSSNMVTWSTWSTSPVYRGGDSYPFTTNWQIQQNRTRYLQVRLNLTSNSPALLPRVTSIILNYYSYDWNYTILELDEFSCTKMGTYRTIWRINITVALSMNAEYMPEAGWIKIYNLVTKDWDILKNGLGGGHWILSGSNLTNYFNGTFYLLFWYISYHGTMEIQKDKTIIFDWRYYIYEETDILTFNVTAPEFIYMNTVYTLPLGNVIGGNISIYNISNSIWITMPLQDYVNYTVPLYMYNKSLIIRTIIVVSSGVPSKLIEVIVFYIPTPPMNWSWIVWVGGGAAVAAIAYGIYWGYMHQGAQSVKEIVVFS